MTPLSLHRSAFLVLLCGALTACGAEEKFDMECTYEEGDTQDTLTFARAGVAGTLVVDAQQFDMTAKLGFLFTAFKDRIEAEIGGQLDALLGTPSPTSLA